MLKTKGYSEGLALTVSDISLELGTSARGQNTRIMWLPGRERSLTSSSAVWIQCTNAMDRWTYGQQTTAKTALMHNIARETVDKWTKVNEGTMAVADLQ